MSIPNRFDIVQKFAAKFGTPDPDNDAARATWTDKLAQTLLALYPDEKWGRKRNGPGRENNPDVLTIPSPFEGVDVLPGSGGISWNPLGVLSPPAEYVAVTPYNYLDANPAPTPDDPGDPDNQPDDDTVVTVATLMVTLLQRLSVKVDAIEELLRTGIKIRL